MKAATKTKTKARAKVTKKSPKSPRVPDGLHMPVFRGKSSADFAREYADSTR